MSTLLFRTLANLCFPSFYLSLENPDFERTVGTPKIHTSSSFKSEMLVQNLKGFFGLTLECL